MIRHAFSFVDLFLNELAVKISDWLHRLLIAYSVPDEGDFPRSSSVEELKGFCCSFKAESVGDRAL